eukprot:CAMPEP_0170519096 /NCGR_PEP_ID=MMETSP0209-20121228/4628_1 /TAXON_ID=665100 ORGANISM="Litonotus pictus, Strain P1" /NCGR_SAMPLE_ID=MMETSP0209 /ASSEMBLY_ACC=CAM_ASM_000301 /LENGTH=759 /DNA_ID=CAMNT_0010804895 /DNA_START=8 /DNA_END=2287 /DNA_ORIENTATION=-
MVTITNSVSLLTFLFTLFTILLETAITQDSSEFNIEGVKHLVSNSIMLEKLKDSETTFFLYYYHPDSENSKMGVKFVNELLPKLNYIAEVLFINCQFSEYSDKNVCKKPEEVKDGFPRMVVLVPPKIRFNPYTKEINKYTEKKYLEKEVSPKSIYKFITDNVPDYSVSLNNDNIDEFLNNSDCNKLLLFTDRDSTPLLYRALSGRFYDRIKFGLVKKEQRDILNRFRVRQFPTLLMYNVLDEGVSLYEPVIDIYNGEINGEGIAEALEFTALPKKRYIIEREANEKREGGKVEDKDKIIEDSNEKPIKASTYFGVKVMNPEITEYYIRRVSNRPMLLSFRKEQMPNAVVELAKKAVGFMTFLDFDCTNPDIEKFVNEKMRFNCTEVDSTSHYYLDASDRSDLGLDQVVPLSEKVEKLTYYNLQKVIRKKFQSNIVDIVSQDYDQVRRSIIRDGKTPFLYLYEDESSTLPFHLVSSIARYKDKIGFISIEYPSSELLNQLKVSISQLPKILAVMPNQQDPKQASIIAFNEEIIFHRLKLFIDTFFVQSSTQQDYILPPTRDISYIQNNKSLKSICHSDIKLCLLGLLDGRPKKNSIIEFEKHIKAIEDVANTKLSKQLEFGWVNATCQTGFATHFNADPDNLPGVVAILPKTKKYAIMFGSFEKENINYFVDRILGGKIPLEDFDNEKVYLRNAINCLEVKDQEEFVSDREDDAITKEILEESKVKREEFEKERKKIMNEGKKKKKTSEEEKEEGMKVDM